MELPRPRWLDDMPDGLEKYRAENRFFFYLWCIYASEKGTLVELSRLIGVNYNTLRSQANNHNYCGASDFTREAIEHLLGSAFLPANRIPDRRFKRDVL
jgi:hypothetical protein